MEPSETVRINTFDKSDQVDRSLPYWGGGVLERCILGRNKMQALSSSKIRLHRCEGRPPANQRDACDAEGGTISHVFLL